jgi:hypothetical protein
MSEQTMGDARSGDLVTVFHSSEVTRSAQVVLLALLLMAVFVGHAGAQAQQKDDARRGREAAEELARRRAQEAIRRAEQEAIRRAEVEAARLAVVAQEVWPDEQFEQWIFQQDRNAAGARQRFDKLLAMQVEEIDRACQLTVAQKKKLQLTGRGDIKRFFDAYDKVKTRFRALNNDVQMLQEIQPDVNPLRTSLQAGLFHDDSLLYKSLRNTLTGEQFVRYDAIARERRAFRHRAAIELAVATLEQSMPLRDEQRRELISLLTTDTKPSRKAGPYDYYLIMFQLGRLPEEKLKPLLTATQWKVVNRKVAQFKAYEAILRRAGQWPVEDDEAASTGEPQPVRKP